MKSFLPLLALPFFLCSPPSIAEDDNYVQPDYVEETTPAWEVSGPRKFLDLSLEEENDLRIPASGDRDEYVEWALSLMLAKKKEALAIAASAQPTGVRGKKCLRFHKSFGFSTLDGQAISTAQNFSVSCFAGGSDLYPTHIVYNNIMVQDWPVACTGKARIVDYFSAENTWNPKGAQDFLTMLKVTDCKFLANSQNHIKKPRRAQEAFDMNGMLKRQAADLINNEEFQLWRQSRGVAGSAKGKKSDGPFRNPIGTVRKKAPPPSERSLEGEERVETIPAR